jgi:hypothetical protein
VKTWLETRRIGGSPCFGQSAKRAAQSQDLTAYISPATPEQPRWSSALPNTDAGPVNLSEGESDRAHATFRAKEFAATGVFFVGSQTTVQKIPDGLSKTLLLGEKYLNPDRYYDGQDSADNEAALIGCNQDITRWTASRPLNDTPGFADGTRFGGPHLGVLGLALCDGAIRFTDVNVDERLFRSLGHRADGEASVGVP